LEAPHSQPYIEVDGVKFLPDSGDQLLITVPNGKPMQLSAPLDCSPTVVSATLAGQTFILSYNDPDGTWTGTIFGSVANPQTLPLTITATGGSCGNLIWIIAQITLIEPSGHVYDSVTQAGINYATVTLYGFDEDEEAYIVWDGSYLGQANPQMTYEDGYFGWDLPAGSYYLTTQKTGYHIYTGVPFGVPPPLADYSIELVPTSLEHRVLLPVLLKTGY
jgi:hypothetical protein